MTIKVLRIIELIIFIFIVVTKTYFLLAYNMVMYLSIEFLNSREEYIAQGYFKFFNAIFIGYQIFICAVRINTFKLSYFVALLINSAEHILFALVICFKISQYLRLRFLPAFSLKQRFWITVLGFNLIGVMNEIWQNMITHRDLFVFLPNAISDLEMNLIGTLIFSVTILYEFRKI